MISCCERVAMASEGTGSAAGADAGVDCTGMQLLVFSQARAVELYARFLGIEEQLEVVPCRYAWTAATGYLPMLRHGAVVVGGSMDIISYLRHTCKHSTAGAAATDETAYAVMINTELTDVELFAQWLYPGQYLDTKRACARRFLFPLSLFAPSYMKRDFERRLAGNGLEEPRQMDVRALRCYTALAAKLRESSGPFLFGKRGTTADALLYGHLRVATQNEPLKELLVGLPELTIFYEHVRSLHFAEDPVFEAPVSLLKGKAKTGGEQQSNGSSAFHLSPTTTRLIVVGAVAAYIVAVRFIK